MIIIANLISLIGGRKVNGLLKISACSDTNLHPQYNDSLHASFIFTANALKFFILLFAFYTLKDQFWSIKAGTTNVQIQ